MTVADAPVGEVARAFLRLGLTAFGGPAAHIAIMEDEFVRRRKWLTHERFLELLAAANLIPGPSSTEMAIYIGYERAGWRGLVLGGACFIAPAAIIVLALAWVYVRFGSLPALAGVMLGVKPIVIGVIAQALAGLAPKAVKGSWWLGAVVACAAVASALGVAPLWILLASGAATAIARAPTSSARAMIFAPTTAAATVAHASLLGLFLSFLKIGALVFGSGYVLLAFLRDDFVVRLHWLTEAQLLDAVAVGQVTPGPVFTSATFIGYLVGGVPGAIVSTIAIFLPGFALVAATRPLLARIRSSNGASAFLDGVSAASVALMAVVTVELAVAAIVDVPTAVLSIVGAVILFRFRVSSTWLVLGGAIAGVVMRRFS